MVDFTAGLWKASKAGPLGECTITSPHGLSGFIAQVQGQGNADLIAAAKDMYAALKLGASKHVCCCGPRDKEMCLKCTFDAAIAKAEGKVVSNG